MLPAKGPRARTKSTRELTADDLLTLDEMISGSETVREYKRKHSPKRGAYTYGTVSMILLYILMECRRQTYRGIASPLSTEDAFILGFPIKDGRIMIPSAAGLNHFVNHILIPNLMTDLSEEFGRYFVSAGNDDSAVTLDSAPP
ncbi:MAG: hypothetical protein LBJ20_06300 [Candidatus Methanoplasma sp.]|jgi:hypothetical protein|nr:hypothetical protein [Candidatus Methanoplasma sp.]